MHPALSKEQLQSVYHRLAKHYDLQHGLITARTDQRGRRLLVDHAVSEGDIVLDCGTGTGSTGILAAHKVGAQGKVTLFDLSEAMLAEARKKVIQAGLLERVHLRTGDMVHLPFADNSFDVVLSSYSLCPLYDPVKGVLEMYRVTRPGGKLAIAHSTLPCNPLLKWLADRVENLAWHFPWLSMGCRAVTVLPALKQAGGEIIYSRHIGVPLWPFLICIVQKPESRISSRTAR
jgi:ubiquinone/menaquinone biosynthesis C-methylase UbiE